MPNRAWLLLCHVCGLQVDKHLPMHLRRKLRPEKPTASTFEMIPATGTLQPSQRQNVQVKFMPTEQVLMVIIAKKFSQFTKPRKGDMSQHTKKKKIILGYIIMC